MKKTMNPKRRLVIGLVLVVLAPLSRAETRLNFVSCPIVRDTATVPCWLSEYRGELYYLGIQTDVSSQFKPPWLGHQVLVEGVVSDAPRICGGIVLDPVRTSVMPELDPSCNTLLPAEEAYAIDFNPRPPGPSDGRLAYQAPGGSLNDTTYSQAAGAQATAAPGVFELTFDFDRSIAFRHPRELMVVIEYAKRTNARHIEVNGRRGAILLSDGTVLVESQRMPRQRAEDVARLLHGAELEAEITVRWSDEPVSADGIDDWRSRSVEVRAAP